MSDAFGCNQGNCSLIKTCTHSMRHLQVTAVEGIQLSEDNDDPALNSLSKIIIQIRIAYMPIKS